MNKKELKKKKQRRGEEKKKRLPSHSVHAFLLSQLSRRTRAETLTIYTQHSSFAGWRCQVLVLDFLTLCWLTSGCDPKERSRDVSLLFYSSQSSTGGHHGSMEVSVFSRREKQINVFFLQSVCSVKSRHLRTTNGSKLTFIYLSFKGQRKYVSRFSPFRGPTAMPCRNSCPWLPKP